VTNQQKLIIALLAAITIFLFAGLACLAVLYIQAPRAAAVAPVIAQAPTSLPPLEPTPSATATPIPSVVPTLAPEVTPTNTRVVQKTATPTVTPTAVNCIHNIANFEASGVVTNEQVETFLRDTLPLEHLNHCFRIRYVSRATDVGSTPAAGRFMPVIRHISVYPVTGVALTADDIFDTLTHEVGHNVHYNMRVDNLELANEWEALYHQEAGFVSAYARTNEFEDFAESYRAYVREPETLLLYSPQKYEFMRINVFAGYEYPR
jgi:hypothetical protein